MGLSRILQHGSLLRRILRSFLNSFYVFDHLSAGNQNLLDTRNQMDFSAENFVIIYASYEMEISDLKNLRKMDIGKVLAIENCDSPSEVIPNDGQHLLRPNRGFDLAAYRDGLRLLRDARYEGGVVLLNSSVYWNFQELKKFLEADLMGNEITFLTRSFQTKEHFQTYFLHIPAIQFVNFLELLEKGKLWRNWRHKRSAVIFGEISLLKKLKKHGFPVKSHYNFDLEPTISRFEILQNNPSTFLVPKYIANPIFRKKKNSSPYQSWI